ncbi:MAG TPA: NTP transferase domain-containing protein [Actinomycetota bacterium]|nr:NTP transferase domain-containing protein [Actinomycetota bacterium]
MREQTEPVSPPPVGLAPRPAVSPPRVAVVLAAGRSERLQSVTGGGSKALVRVGGLALVERQVRTLLAAGIERVIVVCGYHAGPVAAVAKRAAPGRVQTVIADDWEEGNGASLAAAEEAVKGEASFLLVTADHVFSEGALPPLLQTTAPAVLVDPDPSPEVWEEATRVQLDERGFVVRLGKEVEAPVADCGAFVLTPEVFEATRRARAAGDASLSAAVTALVPRGVGAIAIERGTWWHDVDTPEDLAMARRLLRVSLHRPGDGPVSRWLNRRLSIPISWALSSLRPSPDLISVISAGLGVAAAFAFGAGEGLLGALLAQSCSVLDGVDGEIARLTGRAGPRGAALDGFLDRLSDASIAAGLGVWAVAAGVRPSLAIVATSSAVAGAMLSMAVKDRLTANRLRGPSERVLGWLLGGRDGRILLITILGALQLPLAALVVTASTSLLASALRTALARPA